MYRKFATAVYLILQLTLENAKTIFGFVIKFSESLDRNKFDKIALRKSHFGF